LSRRACKRRSTPSGRYSRARFAGTSICLEVLDLLLLGRPPIAEVRCRVERRTACVAAEHGVGLLLGRHADLGHVGELVEVLRIGVRVALIRVYAGRLR